MNREIALKIIEKLDNYARDFDCFEYGLPTRMKDQEEMIDIVMGCFEGAKKTEQVMQSENTMGLCHRV